MTHESPSVSIVIPVLDEERHLADCLDAIDAQTYDGAIEVLVVDGGSTDRTCEIARSRPSVRLLHNPRRIQSAALNLALAEASGEVIVRVDGHCEIAPDYVERCVAVLAETGAAMVGGGMTPVARTPVQAAVAAAMASPLGAGPARFHSSATAGWADTVYLGAYRTELALEVGGYAEDVGVNEDAEFAIRMAPHGGVWFDPSIRSSYEPRDSLRGVARQFFRYGRSRSVTMRRHPGAIAPRQLASPALVLGLLSPWRRCVLGAYTAMLAGWAWSGRGRRPLLAAVVLPVMHLSWGVGFYVGLVAGPPRARVSTGSVPRADVGASTRSR